MKRSERRRRIIELLAHLTATRQVEFSLRLKSKGSEDPDVKAWMELRQAIGLSGYPTAEAAKAALEEII